MRTRLAYWAWRVSGWFMDLGYRISHGVSYQAYLARDRSRR